MNIYFINKTLIYKSPNQEFNFKGCKARLDSRFGTSVGITVEGYGIMPYMVSGEDFFKASTRLPDYTTEFNISNHKLNNNIEMAKNEIVSTKLIAIEDVEVGVLPPAPAEFTLGGVKFSVHAIEKAVEAVKKHKITDASSKDAKKTYEFLKEKRQEFVKTRTSAATARKKITDPIDAWKKEFKLKVEDEIGQAAKKGEEYCLSQIKVYEDYEAEQKRLEEVAKAKLVTERSKELLELGGQMNPESEHWTFPYAPHLTVEKKEIEVEVGWEGILEKVKDEHTAHQKKLEAERKEKEEALKSVISARSMMLEMLGYTKTDKGFSKDDASISEEELSSLTDADFKALIEANKAPKKAVDPFLSAMENSPSETPVQPQSEAPSPVESPFAKLLKQTGATTAPVNAPAPEPVKVVETVEVDKYFTGEIKAVERSLNNTTIRVYPTEYKQQNTDNIPNVASRQVYAGDFGNGLSFIIYKNEIK